MQILETDCPHCGKAHNAIIQPVIGGQQQTHALRAALAAFGARHQVEAHMMHAANGGCEKCTSRQLCPVFAELHSAAVASALLAEALVRQALMEAA